MEQMEVLIINGERDVYALPAGVSDIDDMLDFVNENINRYVKLFKIGCHDCIYPFLIEEFVEYTPVCINFANFNGFETTEAYVLTKEEYDERLAQLIDENCHDCINYEDGDDIDSHRNHMCLNGFCPEYRSKYDVSETDEEIIPE